MENKNYERKEVLSERRLEIAQYLFKFSVSTIEQIRRDIFKGGALTFIYKEMRHLEKQGFVNRVYFVRKGRAKGAYMLTQKGLKAIVLQSEEKLATEKFRPFSIAHDLELVDIAFAFQKFGIIKNYWTENQIVSNPERLRDEDLWQIDSLRPDALMKLEGREGRDFFAIEYEATLKYLDGIRSKVNRYYDCKEVFGAFFICKSKKIANAFKSVEKKYYAKNSPKIFYVTLEEFKKTQDVLIFFDRNDEDLQISK